MMDADTQDKLAAIAASEKTIPTAVGPVKGTNYFVFHSSDTATELNFLSKVTALNDLAAIKAAINNSTPQDGASYVAIPERSLRVRTVKVESQPKVVLS